MQHAETVPKCKHMVLEHGHLLNESVDPVETAEKKKDHSWSFETCAFEEPDVPGLFSSCVWRQGFTLTSASLVLFAETMRSFVMQE